MNKKSSSVLMMVAEVLVVAIVVAGAFNVAKNLANDQSVNRILFAEDIRLMVNTLVGMPGDAKITYPYDITSFVFVFSSRPETRIIVYNDDQEGDLKAQIERKFYLPKGYKVVGQVKDASSLCIKKEGKTIKIGEKC